MESPFTAAMMRRLVNSTIPAAMVIEGIRIGNWAASGALGRAVPFAAAMNVHGDGQMDVFGVYGETDTNLTSAVSAKAIRARHVVSGSGLTVAQETYGLVGQVCAKGATLTHLHGGLMGTFEGTGAAVVCNSSYSIGHAAVLARIGGHANITATTPVAGFLAFHNAGAALAAGISAAFAASSVSATYPWSIGVYLPVGSVRQAIRVGNWVGSGATGSGIPISSATDSADTTQRNLVACYGESTGDLGSGVHANVGRFRHLASGSGLTVAQELYGLVGQLCGKGVTLTHLGGGLMGTFEGTGAAVVCNSSYSIGHAAVLARIGGHANITATTPVAGFLAFHNAGAALAAGISAAFAASSVSATYPWSIGVYLPVGSVRQAIRVGNWVGSGATGSGIPLSAATDSADTTQRNLVACYGESTGDLGSGVHANVGRFRHLVSGSGLTVAQETYGLVGQIAAKGVTLTHMHAGLMGTFEGTGAAVVANSAYTYGTAAVIGRVGGGANITATKCVCGFSAILNGAAMASGTSSAFASDATSTGDWDYGLSLKDCTRAFNFVGACVDANTAGAAAGLQVLIHVNGQPYALSVCAVGTGG